MNQRITPNTIIRYYAKWISISVLIGIFSGSASAIFLLILEKATRIREENSWLVLLLPLGGILVGAVYQAAGEDVESGNNLLIDEFHDPRTVIPFRMAPLVLLGTLLTHIFGGSAGREGTAVQMGGSIADQLTHVFNVSRAERRTLLMAGMAGGFGSVFGVPLAGTIFGLEVLAVGRLHLWGLLECAAAAFVAHHTTLSLGAHHTLYPHPAIPELSWLLGSAVVGAGILFGLAARAFAILADQIKSYSKRLIANGPVRAGLGGAIIALSYFLLPSTTRYAGLGVPVIIDSLRNPVPLYDWFGKIVYTAVTLGTGFKGGEVTPLLFVGSTLGNALSHFLPIALPLAACLGFVAVFAGAANTPFACTLMAVELFGSEIWVFAAIACFASFAVSGHHGIYHAQKIHFRKSQYASRTIDILRWLFHRPALEGTPADNSELVDELPPKKHQTKGREE